MRAVFVTFADGGKDFLESAQRLRKQAESTGLFSTCVALDSEALAQLFPTYAEDLPKIRNLDVFPLYFRAAKTWAVLAAFNAVFGSFDVLVYMDSGCEIQNNWLARLSLKSKLAKALKYGGLAESTMLPEKEWTKAQLLQKFALNGDVVDSKQVQATWSIWRNTPDGLKLAQDWRDISLSTERLWQDPPSSEKQGGLVEHRRDQSIFSLLWKQANFLVEPNSMDFSPIGFLGTLRSLAIPIHATRNRTGKVETAQFPGRGFFAPIGWLINSTIYTIQRSSKQM